MHLLHQMITNSSLVINLGTLHLFHFTFTLNPKYWHLSSGSNEPWDITGYRWGIEPSVHFSWPLSFECSCVFHTLSTRLPHLLTGRTDPFNPLFHPSSSGCTGVHPSLCAPNWQIQKYKYKNTIMKTRNTKKQTNLVDPSPSSCRGVCAANWIRVCGRLLVTRGRDQPFLAMRLTTRSLL